MSEVQTHEPFKPTPDEDGTVSVRALITEALGAASVSWHETPQGIFDSERAIEIVEGVTELLEGAGIDCDQRIWVGQGSR